MTPVCNPMKAPNTVYHNATVNREGRNQLNSHKSVVIWFTGLSGSGKSTLSHSVEEKLHNLGCRIYVLDGDNVRHGLSSNLTFSDNDRKENIRRIGEVAKLMMEARVISMTAFISPFKKDRNLVRQLLPQGDFVEKPDLKTEKVYLEQGSYLWNSGMFMFQTHAFINELTTYSPNIVTSVNNDVNN